MMSVVGRHAASDEEIAVDAVRLMTFGKDRVLLIKDHVIHQ